MTTTTASWDGSASKIPDFINDLFSKNVRNSDLVSGAITSGENNYSFTDTDTLVLILNAWLAAWQQHNGDGYDEASYGRCPSDDRILIGVLSDYIKDSSLSPNFLWLYVPDLSYVKQTAPDSDGNAFGIYKNSGYNSKPFLSGGKWNYGSISGSGKMSYAAPQQADTVINFLFHLFYGAHCVVVSNGNDLNKGSAPKQFWDYFNSDKGDPERGSDKFNSHYSAANFTGYYHLNICRDKEPSTNPLLTSFLVALTDPASLNDLAPLVGAAPGALALSDASSRHKASNTFIQLEGWQSHFPYVGGRHAADYAAHEASLWNFSTFGACVYSEKRSTPIFLANSKFNTAINADTKMPLYNGASSKQSWMNPDLLQVPKPA